ncbi:MAG: SPOR domain-containing protein [Microbacteriaceae bacterium]|nr:SPOR domain-containing protein [Microbacteriaceae bacterium]
MGDLQGNSEKYWFNTKTGQVEQGAQSLSSDRLGPFDTAEEAANAQQKVQDRAAEWQAEEAAEDSWGE